jgi:two-component system OmpR family sensor kinase
VTLRARLLLALITVVAVGLVVADVVTYTQLRSFLLARVGPQLRVASFSMTRALEAENGLGPSLPFVPRSGSSSQFHPTPPPPSQPSANQAPGRRGFTTPRDGLEPAGTVGELIGPTGKRVGKVVSVIYSGNAPPLPVLPNPLPPIGKAHYVVFNAPSSGGGAISYRVLERRLSSDHLRVVVAIPLSDVNDTLGRLRLVELLVSAVMLGALAFLSWWIIRRGLRPLEDMAETAGEIARGELDRRVAPSDERTEVGRLGLALNAMLTEIEEAFVARAASEDRLRRFLADASHELRTPLTAIRGHAELFDMGAKERPADLAASMHHIQDEAERMAVLVDDLLLLARLDHERPVDLRPSDLVPVIRKAVDAAWLVNPEHPIEFTAPERLVVPCDLARLRQVVDNLVVNAVRHSPDRAPVEVGLFEHGGSVVLTVRDHGAGVADEDVERIFAPFHRADFARARSEGGAGLGLAIVAAIARAHGGAAGVRRPEGSGAEFWVRLPASTDYPVVDRSDAVHSDTAQDAGSTGNQQLEQRSDTAAPV